MPCRPDNTSRSDRRRGFTLIEIMIVILIIGILTGIVFAVYTDSITQGRAEATRATVRILDSHLQQRQEAFQRLNFRSQAQQFKQAYDFANPPPPGNPGLPLDVAEMIVFKDRFRGAFPQRLEDTWGFNGMPGGDVDAPLWAVWRRRHAAEAALATAGPTPQIPTNATPRRPYHRHDLESIELLVLALTEGGAFGTPSGGLDAINPNHFRDTGIDWNEDGNITNDTYPTGDDLDGNGVANGNGIPDIHDDWGNPLRFYNWPTRLVRHGGDPTGAPVANINIGFYEATAGRFFTGVADPVSPPGVPPSPVMPYWFYAHPLNQDPQDPTSILALARDYEDLNRDLSLDTTTPPVPYAENGEDFNNDGALDSHPNVVAPLAPLPVGTPFALGAGGAQPIDERFYHTLNTYHMPLIVSAGADGRIGLYEPNARDPRSPGVAPAAADFPRRLAQTLYNPSAASPDPDLLDQLYDNITNRRR